MDPVGGFEWEILEPLQAWRIRFDGRLNDAGDDPALPVDAVVAVGDGRGATVDVSYDLVFERDKPAYLYDENPAWELRWAGFLKGADLEGEKPEKAAPRRKRA